MTYPPLAEVLAAHGLTGAPEEALQTDGWSGAQMTRLDGGGGAGFVLKRDLLKLWIVTYGREFGTANCEFRRHGQAKIGRQSHTWMRTPEGWRIVAAHVSLLGDSTVMKK